MEDRKFIKQIIETWKDHFNDRIPIDRQERINAFFFLFENLMELGKCTLDDIISLESTIIEFCIPDENYDKKKRKNWKLSALKDFQKACRLKAPLELKMHTEDSVIGLAPLELTIIPIKTIEIKKGIEPDEAVIERRGKEMTPEMLEKLPKLTHEMDKDFIEEMGIVVNLDE